MILITGGAGFIGYHLTHELLKNKNNVIVIDNFDPYYDENIKKNNLNELSDYKNFLFIKEDITDVQSLKKIFKKYSFQIVYHLAARPGVRPSFINPYIYDQINVQGTYKLLYVCNLFNVRKIIFASSSSVYGKNSIPFKEDQYPLHPLSVYGCSKLNAEEVCKFFCRRYGFQIWIFRLFSIYGPKLRPDLAMYKFTKAILEDKEILLYNFGKYKRDFTYITNIIEILIKSKNSFPDTYEIVNLGNSQPLSIKNLVTLLEQKLNKKAKIKLIKNPYYENPITYASIEKVKKIFGYTAFYPIDKGLDNFLRWFLNKK
ncbi:MAG: NAD-dependent epimerase/dehydratase family protein [Planctomycetota bacterium]